MCGEENNPELTVAERKKILRKKAKTVLKEYFSDRELAKAASASILDYFIQSDIYKAAPAIFGFMPMPDEVDVIPILERALKDGKKVSVPKMIPGTNQMDFYEIKSLYDVEEGQFHVMEPKMECKLFLPQQEDEVSIMDGTGEELLVLVPGVVFDCFGNRYGYGKGYYDRYFARFPFLKRIALAYSEQLADEPLECLETDVKMQAIATEREVIIVE